MAEDLGAPSQTAANGKEQTWRLEFELADAGGVEITAHRRVVLRDASNDIVDKVEDPEMIEFLFPGSKYKTSRPITLAELEAKTPGLAASIQSTIDAIVVDQKATEP
jgi:hypothetical protein